MRKKILFINRMSPFSPGGARKVVWELGKEMARRDWEVHFFYASHLDGGPTLENIYFHPVKAREDYLKMTYDFVLKGPSVFRKVLREVGPDLVYDNANPTPFVPAYFLAKNKLVTRVHHVVRREAFQLKSGFVNPVATFLLEEFLRLADGNHVIVDSASTKSRISGLVKNPEKITVIPPGIDRLAGKVLVSEGRNPGQVSCVCRMATSKGVDYLIRAWELVEVKHPEARLIIAGKGPQEAEFRELARSLRLKNCEIRGFISDEEKDILISTSVLSILPTLIEGMPIGILDAMLRGVAIVTTNTWGVKDIIKDGVNGRLVPTRDHLALAEVICALLENPREAQRLAEESLRNVEDYYIERVNDREIRVLDGMLASFH